MTDLLMVTVVIPTWQRAHLIRDALDSVAAQTWRPLEIVVADDGSTDGTGDVVAKWAAAHPVVPLRHVWQENAGGNAARNRGITEARGDYVAFLDSDDTWSPDKTARQMALLTGGGRIGAVYCGLEETDARTGAVLQVPPIQMPTPDMLGRLLVRDETAPTSAWIIARDVLRQVGGFDEDLRARQDWDLWIRVAAVTRLGAVDAPLMQLRHHDGPRTASDPTRELRSYAAIRAKNHALLAAQPLTLRLAARAAYHRRAGRVHLHYMGHRGRALGHYIVAVTCWPVAPDNWYALAGWFLPGGLRARLRKGWNRLLGRTRFGIRSH